MLAIAPGESFDGNAAGSAVNTPRNIDKVGFNPPQRYKLVTPIGISIVYRPSNTATTTNRITVFSRPYAYLYFRTLIKTDFTEDELLEFR